MPTTSEHFDLLREFRRIVAGDCIVDDIERHRAVVTAIEQALRVPVVAEQQISATMAFEDEMIAREQSALRAGIEKARKIVMGVATRIVRKERVQNRTGDDVQLDILNELDKVLLTASVVAEPDAHVQALNEIEVALISIADGVSPQVAVGQAFAVINRERLARVE